MGMLSEKGKSLFPAILYFWANVVLGIGINEVRTNAFWCSVKCIRIAWICEQLITECKPKPLQYDKGKHSQYHSGLLFG